ncbi:MAG TPA: alpha/beta fold hydrolase [Paenirhodobacter sp.]
MTNYVILPGYTGSGETHWQTLWERQEPRMRRFSPSSWDAPDRDDWIAALDRMVGAAAGPCVLVAHSLSCLLVAQWAQLPGRAVAGAFLVAPPDPAAADFPRAEAAGFVDVPKQRIGFPTLIVASANDPYSTLDVQRKRAADWGAGFIEIGALGHINGSSGLGDWPEGRRLLQAFVTGLGV